MSDFIRQGQEWVTPDGFRFPVISGASDAPVGTDLGTTTDQNSQGNDQGLSAGQETDYSGYSDFVQGILKDASPEHLPILKPYLDKWNAGTTRRFTELQNQLKPYQELGDFDTVQEAIQLYQMLDDEEQTKLLYQSLQEYFKEDFPVTGNGAGSGNQSLPSGNVDSNGEFQGLPPAVAQQLEQQNQMLQTLAQYVLDDRKSKEQAQEDQQLDSILSQLKKEFGDFDEDYVLAKLDAGVDPVEAVKSYQAIGQQFIQNYTKQQNVPPILGGGGSVPQESQNLAKIPSRDLKQFVAGILEQQANQD